jgi:predicted lipoprotein with Yx(FWY)xxD motif
MKYPTFLGAMLALALLLAACAPAATPTTIPADTSEPTIVATEPPATDTAAATESPVASEPAATDTQAAAESPTAGVPVTGATTVSVSQSTDFGSILVDGQGHALYILSNDTPDSGTSACTDDCATEWPPLLSDGAPVAGAGVDASLLGTITRDDGTMQVTYNGHPLYLFHEDMAAGDTNGQGVSDEFGQWHLASPAGEPIQ